MIDTNVPQRTSREDCYARSEPAHCALRFEMLAYQRLPRSPRSPPRPPPPPWPPRPPPPPPWPPRPPPYPPRPPPPPLRSAWGRASFTTRFRPPKFCPFRELIDRKSVV